MQDLPIQPAKPTLSLSVEGGPALDVRDFHVQEALSELFSVDLVCVLADPSVPLDDLVGRAASFAITRGSVRRTWTGVVCAFGLAQAEDTGVTTYALRIVPGLWLLSQTRTYRVFQQITDPDIAIAVLGRRGITPHVALREPYKRRRYRTQYAESDFTFASRMLEDAGVTYRFDTTADGESALWLDDAPHRADVTAHLPFVEEPTRNLAHDYVTDVRLHRTFVPGRYTQQDLDYRQPPDLALVATAAGGLPSEQARELHHYVPGAFLFESPGHDTPVADDRGAHRTDLGEGSAQAQKRLHAKRGKALRVTFVTSAIGVRPGQVISVTEHPRRDISQRPMLVVSTTLRGNAVDDWHHAATAQFTDSPFRPELATPKPRTHGVESAVVVGAAGDEIHTDEMGRVRVHFRWDREGAADETSSLWVPVNQPWGGTSFGALNIPRVGQEVLVDFLDGDPDRPVVIGRVFTLTNPPPYKLPQFHDVQGLRSASTPALPPGVARSGMLGGKTAGGGDGSGSASPQSSPLGGGMPLSLDKLTQLIRSSPLFGAGSPNGETLAWQGSELTMHDVQGQETMYLQAQKDFSTVVKNEHKAIVGHAKAEIVGSDNIEHSGNKEVFQVASDRTGLVGGSQAVVVQQAAYRESGDAQLYLTATTYDSQSKNTPIQADDALGSEAKVHTIRSGDETVLMCGASSIILRPDGISINAPLVLINPGNISIQTAAQAESLQAAQQAEKERAERDARVAAAQEQLLNGPFVPVPEDEQEFHRPALVDWLQDSIDGLTEAEAEAVYDAWSNGLLDPAQ